MKDLIELTKLSNYAIIHESIQEWLDAAVLPFMEKMRPYIIGIGMIILCLMSISIISKIVDNSKDNRLTIGDAIKYIILPAVASGYLYFGVTILKFMLKFSSLVTLGIDFWDSVISKVWVAMGRVIAYIAIQKIYKATEELLSSTQFNFLLVKVEPSQVYKAMRTIALPHPTALNFTFVYMYGTLANWFLYIALDMIKMISLIILFLITPIGLVSIILPAFRYKVISYLFQQIAVINISVVICVALFYLTDIMTSKLDTATGIIAYTTNATSDKSEIQELLNAQDSAEKDIESIEVEAKKDKEEAEKNINNPFSIDNIAKLERVVHQLLGTQVYFLAFTEWISFALKIVFITLCYKKVEGALNYFIIKSKRELA